jgi:cytochrome d ubiquinol oxidase subunit II
VWDLFAIGPRAEKQRQLIAKAIGPIWEAHHVWLIFAIVVTFVALPKAFAAITTVLHIPIALMLLGICLRGSSFVFRAYASQEDEVQRRWSRVFAISSVYTPVMLGVCAGAVSSGAIRMGADGRVVPDFLSAWLAPFPFAIGGFTLALFSLLAAVYLTVEAREPSLREDFRRRALIAAVVAAAMAYVCLALARQGAPHLWDALTARDFSGALQVVVAAVGFTLVAALWARLFHLARVLAVLLVVLVEIGWAAGHLPYVIPPDLTVSDAAAPASVIRPILLVLAAGTLVLLPAFVYLYLVFKAPAGARDG